MNTLDSPLEALTLNHYLNYYTFLTSAVNSLWAWIAVITAAVSFWKIKALSSSSPPPEPPVCNKKSEPTKSSDEELNVVEEPSFGPTTTSCCILEGECSTKTKFSLYFENDDLVREDVVEYCNGTGTMVSETKYDDEKVMGREWDYWERMMEVRMGDMGWYRWQDWTSLDGNVVRLWDGTGRRRRRASTGYVVNYDTNLS